MKASFKQRMGAYLIDLMVLIGVFCLIYFLIPENAKNAILEQELNLLNESFIKEEIIIGDYFNSYGNIMYELDKNNIINSIINIIILVIYFIIVPFITNGKTLGKYILGIKIKSKDKENVSILGLIIRNLIFNGLIYLLGSLLLLIITKGTTYFIFLIILGIIQIILSLISLFMVIYRKDFRGLHDILSNTKVLRGE